MFIRRQSYRGNFVLSKFSCFRAYIIITRIIIISYVLCSTAVLKSTTCLHYVHTINDWILKWYHLSSRMLNSVPKFNWILIDKPSFSYFAKPYHMTIKLLFIIQTILGKGIFGYMCFRKHRDGNCDINFEILRSLFYSITEIYIIRFDILPFKMKT